MARIARLVRDYYRARYREAPWREPPGAPAPREPPQRTGLWLAAVAALLALALLPAALPGHVRGLDVLAQRFGQTIRSGVLDEIGEAVLGARIPWREGKGGEP